MNPLRAGIVGCGSIARKHAAAAKSVNDIHLLGFYDHTLENAQRLAREMGGGQAYNNLAAMLDELELQLLYICLPPFAHTDEVALACKRGIHFLIEKPIALTLEKAQAMVQAVEASGVKTLVGFMYRQGSAVQWLKEYLQAHPSPAFMVGRYACNSLHRPWWRNRELSGGQLFEQIIHLLDLSRYLLGKPVTVLSMQDNLFHRSVPDYTVEDASGTLIRFANGSLAVIAATNGAIPGRWDSDWRVMLPALTADFSNANRAVMHQTDVSPVIDTVIESDENLFRLQTLDLLRAIRDDHSTRAPIREGLRSLALAVAAVRSASEAMPITLA